MPPDANSRAMVREYLLQSAAVKCQVAEQCRPSILVAAPTTAETCRTGGKVLLCGNGGSAADCQHLATECVSLTQDVEGPGLPALACTTDTSFLTAFALDCGFEGVFARQVQALGKPGDVLIGISTSGNSTHVLRAIEAATVGHHMQEAHLAIAHILCALVEQHLFPTASRTTPKTQRCMIYSIHEKDCAK